MDHQLQWFCHPFDEFSVQSLYQALRLRDQVFVLEQQSIYGDLDNEDQAAWHIRGLNDEGELVAYARLLPPGKKASDAAAVGRVVIRADQRGHGYGKQLLAVTLEQCERLYPGAPIVLSAQASALSLYKNLGFIETSQPYDDGGVMHVDMRRD